MNECGGRFYSSRVFPIESSLVSFKIVQSCLLNSSKADICVLYLYCVICLVCTVEYVLCVVFVAHSIFVRSVYKQYCYKYFVQCVVKCVMFNI